NEEEFRSDLYYRLAVLPIRLPPLRERPEDIPLLVEHVLASLRADTQAAAGLRAPPFLAQLRRAAWPGNVRELRNFLERCLVLREELSPGDPAAEPALSQLPIDPDTPYGEARRRLLEAWEGRYLR